MRTRSQRSGEGLRVLNKTCGGIQSNSRAGTKGFTSRVPPLVRCSQRYCRGHSSGSAPARLPRSLPSTSLFRDGTQPPARCVKTLFPCHSRCCVCSSVHSDNLYRKSRRSDGYSAAGTTKRIVGEYALAFAALPERQGCALVAANFPLTLSRVKSIPLPP